MAPTVHSRLPWERRGQEDQEARGSEGFQDRAVYGARGMAGATAQESLGGAELRRSGYLRNRTE